MAPNHSANDGIDVIFTHVIVVPSVGTNGLLASWNVHLSAHESDNMIVYVHAVAYVCPVSAVRFHAVQSHQSTVYALAKYLLIVIVCCAAVDVASRIISLSHVFAVETNQFSCTPHLHG